MRNSRKIRSDLIAPNLDELRTYGNLEAIPPKEKRRGRPVMMYYLNKDQALLLCMFSRTDKAADVRKEVITVLAAQHLRRNKNGLFDNAGVTGGPTV